MLIDEAIQELTEHEKKIHEQLKTMDEKSIMEYAIKRSFYQEPTQEEVGYINDIYEGGSTIFEVDILSLGKTHKMRLLSQKEKNQINQLADKRFNKPTKGEDPSFFSEEAKSVAITEFKLIATVAYSLVEVNGDPFSNDVAKHFKTVPDAITAEQKIEYCELLPTALLRTLYDRYMEIEQRLFTIFQYESIRKK